MKIYIDYNKLKNEPYKPVKNESINKKNECAEDEISCTIEIEDDYVYQFQNHIIYCNPSCFLVSGYRGVGKTSFVNMIKENVNLKYPETIFITLNINKYEEKNFLIRKMIRTAYLSIISNKNAVDSINKQDNELIQILNLLYERTFYEVLKTYKNSKNNDITNTITTEVNIKKIIELLGVEIFTIINIKFGFINNAFNYFSVYFSNSKIILDAINIVIFIVSTAFLCIEGIKLKSESIQKKSKSEELSRKTLYDDEIAEYQLINVLERLHKLKIKTVIIIDELDKIDNDEHIQLLINQLKPLMLSGIVNFILVSGQGLYYQLLKCATADDSVISGIFSKLIHVQLPSIETLKKLFYEIMKVNDDLKNELVDMYISSIILETSRIPRKFINYIRQNLIWEDDTAYIDIDENDIEILKTDYQILQLLKNIEDDYIQGNYENGISDFFVSQLYIWIRMMKLKGNNYFKKEEIYNYKEDDNTSIPFWFKTELNEFINVVLENMVNSTLIEIKKEIEDESESVYYRWSKNAKIVSNFEDSAKVTSLFLESFIEIEKLLREIYRMMDFDKERIQPSITKMIERLVSKEVLDKRLLKYSSLRNIIVLRNKVVHGTNIEDDDIESLSKYRFELTKYKSDIINMYLIYELKEILMNIGEVENYNIVADYNIDKEYKTVAEYNLQEYFDIIADSYNKSLDIVVELKCLKVVNQNKTRQAFKNFLDKYKKYSDFKQNNAYTILVIYSEKNLNNERYEYLFTSEVKNYSNLSDKFFLIYASDIQMLSRQFNEYVRNLFSNKRS